MLYNPRQLEPEQIEASFIARQETFQAIFEDIVSETSDSAPQHHIIIGQRGMGKTTLLRRLGVELNKPSYCEQFVPLSFPEEQHILIDRLSVLWLNSLDALASVLEQRGKKTEVSKLDRTIQQLPREFKDEEELAHACYKELLTQCRYLNLRPVFLLDNFPLLMERLKEHQWDIRSLLQEVNAPIFVTAGLALPESLGNYEEAFHDMFKARILYSLTLEECAQVYRVLAKRNDRPDLIQTLHNHNPRLKVLHQLTGGNPRTVGMLYELYSKGPGDDAWEDLRSLLDKSTPLYQSRLDLLSDKAQQIFGALALLWRPVLQSEIETQTQLPQGTVSSTLQRLEKGGVVERVDLFDQKKNGWQIAERFFNIWFLMRFATRRTQGTIGALAAFLEIFYSKDELTGIAHSLRNKHGLDPEQAHYSMALSQAMEEGSLAREISHKAHLEILRHQKELSKVIEDFAEVSIPREVIDFVEFRDEFLPSLVPPDAEVEKTEFARLVISSISTLEERKRLLNIEAPLDKESVRGWFTILQDGHEALLEDIGEEATRYLEDRLYQGLLHDWHSESQWQDIIENTDIPELLFTIGNLINQDIPTSALQSYRKAIDIKPDYHQVWNNLGVLLKNDLRRVDDAEEAYREAININPNDYIAWSNLGSLLQNQLRRFDEAEEALRKAIEIKPNYHEAWNNLGTVLHLHLQRFDEAEIAYRKASGIEPNRHEAWNNLGVLLEKHLQRFGEAEEAYRKAIDIKPDSHEAWNNLGILLRNHLRRFDDSLEAFLKVCKIDENQADWNSIGNLYADYLKRPKEAEQSYRKGLAADSEAEMEKQNLVFLLRDQLEQADEARELFDTIDLGNSSCRDSYHLQESLFALHAQNLGDSKESLRKAFEQIEESFSSDTIDDWYRTAAVWLDLGSAESFLEVAHEVGADERLLPFIEAVRAHHLGHIGFLDNIPQEAQTAAKEIFQEIEYRRKLKN